MKSPVRGWEFAIATLAGVAAAFAMPKAFYAPGVAEIVTVLGFLMAALVPSMALAATAVRAGGFSVRRVREMGLAIDRQIQVFGGLFLYALAACIILIVGKLVCWTIPPIPSHLASWPQVSMDPLWPATLTFLLIFLTLRSLAFVMGILSILRLSTQIAEDEARARDRKEDVTSEDDLSKYEMPGSYGTRLDVSH